MVMDKQTLQEALINKFTSKLFDFYFKCISIFNIFNRKKIITHGLIHHWSFCDTLNDAVGKAHLYSGENYSFISGSNGMSYSAIKLESGYLEVPQGVYFNGDFTISAWVRLNVYSLWARLIDFGDSHNGILFSLFNGYSANPVLLSRLDAFVRVISNENLIIGEWYHITGLLEKNLGKIYINGRLDSTTNLRSPNNISRYPNYIGKSHSSYDAYAFADIYDLKILNRALKNKEIINNMN